MPGAPRMSTSAPRLAVQLNKIYKKGVPVPRGQHGRLEAHQYVFRGFCSPEPSSTM